MFQTCLQILSFSTLFVCRCTNVTQQSTRARSPVVGFDVGGALFFSSFLFFCNFEILEPPIMYEGTSCAVSGMRNQLLMIAVMLKASFRLNVQCLRECKSTDISREPQGLVIGSPRLFLSLCCFCRLIGVGRRSSKNEATFQRVSSSNKPIIC